MKCPPFGSKTRKNHKTAVERVENQKRDTRRYTHKTKSVFLEAKLLFDRVCPSVNGRWMEDFPEYAPPYIIARYAA